MKDKITSPPEPRVDLAALQALPSALQTTRKWSDARGDHVEVVTTVDDEHLFAAAMFLAEALIEEPAELAQWHALIGLDDDLARAAQWMDATHWLVRDEGVPDFTTAPPTPRFLVTLHPSVELGLRGIASVGSDLTQRVLGAWRKTTTKKPKGQEKAP